MQQTVIDRTSTWMWISGLVLFLAVATNGATRAQPSEAIIKNYLNTTVTEPPSGFHAFFDKYTSAEGIPVLASEDVPDVGLLVARDVILEMLAKRPSIQDHMRDQGYKLGVMADTDSTMDIPWYSDFEKPDSVGQEMTVAEYWNQRARGMGGDKVTCAEENILGYPGTKYFGENILVHEFSHSIHQAIRATDPELASEIDEEYQDAMANGLWEDHYASTNSAEYFAEGTQFWFNSNYQYEHEGRTVLGSADLMRYDPKLYNLLEEVYPSDHHIHMDVFYKHDARVE